MKYITAQFEVDDDFEPMDATDLVAEAALHSWPIRILDNPPPSPDGGEQARAQGVVGRTLISVFTEGKDLNTLGVDWWHEDGSSTPAGWLILDPQPSPSDNAQLTVKTRVHRINGELLGCSGDDCEWCKAPQPAMQTLQDAAANAMTDFEVTNSIIYKCPALRLPQSFAEKLCAVSQIVVLKGATDDVARFIADACNEKTERLSSPQAVASTSDAVAQPITETALQKFIRFGGDEETDPIERLRFFCAQSMQGQDWLDVEPFIGAVAQLAEAQEQNAKDISAMVDRFLGWKLPKDFAPDSGIMFTGLRRHEEGDCIREYDSHWWPVGTNLFTADQARQMFEYVLASAATKTEEVK